jgi:predicted dehydrogenase
MKKITLLYIVAVMTAVVAGVLACGKTEKNVDVRVAQVSTTNCGTHAEGLEAKDLDDGEQYLLSYDGGALQVTHVNWVVPCDFHNVRVTVAVEEDTIVIDESNEGGDVDCICRVDNRYWIENVTQGMYTIIFKVGGEEHHRCVYNM